MVTLNMIRLKFKITLTLALMMFCFDVNAGITLDSCNKIKFSRDDGACECISKKVGDSDEVVALLKWIEIEKKKDKDGFPMFGWITQIVAKDEILNKQLGELIQPLGRKKGTDFMSCLIGAR